VCSDSGTRTQDTNLGVAAEVDGHESNPDDACCVHGETNELGLVEVFWDVTCLDGIQRAEQYQQEVEGEGGDDAERRRVAGEHDAVERWVQQRRGGGLQNQHGGRDAHLDADQRARYEHLRITD